MMRIKIFEFVMLTSLMVIPCYAKQRTTIQSIIDGMVKIPDRDFWLSETELTQGQWEAVMGYNPSGHKGANLPVETVSKNDADIFIDKLNACAEIKASKFEFGLPTPGEWLCAASAGGSNHIEDRAWIKENSAGVPHDVATKTPNAFGIYDIQGNVWEWLDGPKNAKGERRGGSYGEPAGGCSIHRWIHTPRGRRYDSCGFRVAAYLRGSRKPKQPANVQSTGVQQNITSSYSDSNTRTYQKCKDAIAVVEGDVVDGRYGRGTGFLCEMAGKKYFVTNKHVATQRGKITAYFLDGQIIEFRPDATIEVAANRDLVRFELQTSRTCLKLLEKVPSIGDRIEFYGNAEGQKVITVTAGKILAVGQEEIEIDSQIQGGNSGSPLVRVEDGLVIGVTTRSQFNKVNNDLSKVGTRYDPQVKLTREFAVRFSSVMWTSQKYGEFLDTINTFKDFCEFWVMMRKVCNVDNPSMILEYAIPDLKFSRVAMLNKQIRSIAKRDEELKKSRDKYALMLAKNKSGKRMASYGQFELNNAKERIRDNMIKSYCVRNKVLKDVLAYVKSCKTLTAEDKEDLVSAFDWQLRAYGEKFRMQLNGEDLPVYGTERTAD